MEEAMKGDRMVEDSGVSNSSIEFWLNKTLEWDQITTLESQQDVCLHLPELQEFLLQIYGALKHMNSTTAVQKFPLIGQLLGRLCWNPFVIGYDECQKILMRCLCCLYSGEPQNPLELKANSWIQKTLCHLLSFCGLGNHDTDINKFISTLGFTSVDYYSKLIENIVSSLVMELSRTQVNGFNSQQNISCRVTSMSLLCVPLITLPDIKPLLEALLNYHDHGPQEVLHSQFLEAVNEAILRKNISLSETAVLQLWLRHLPSLEKAILQNIEQLISSQTRSMQEMACVIKDSLLHRAACHPAVFRTIDEIFKNALLETDGAQEIMTVMQVFTQCFVQAYHENNKQHKFPLKAYFPHNPHSLVMTLLKLPSDFPGNSVYQHLDHLAEILKTTVEAKGSESLDELFNSWFLLVHFGEWADLAAKQLLLSQAESSNLLWLLVFYYSPNNMNWQRTQIVVEARTVCDYLTSLSRMPTISVADLQTLFSSKTSVNHSATKHIVTHLMISFVLFTPNGHTIARELIEYILAESDEIPQVTGLLIHISNTASQLGVKYQCSVKLANDLLQEFRCGA
ncbi:Fanconi anemia group C protein [Pituophis catenifer annectens]|uniref:Fanconi anemia group C protein n=1 Tax=Pituophis catenifer annectens TaxID=94852 RepID=UPI0039911A37